MIDCCSDDSSESKEDATSTYILELFDSEAPSAILSHLDFAIVSVTLTGAARAWSPAHLLDIVQIIVLLKLSSVSSSFVYPRGLGFRQGREDTPHPVRAFHIVCVKHTLTRRDHTGDWAVWMSELVYLLRTSPRLEEKNYIVSFSIVHAATQSRHFHMLHTRKHCSVDGSISCSGSNRERVLDVQ